MIDNSIRMIFEAKNKSQAYALISDIERVLEDIDIKIYFRNTRIRYDGSYSYC